MLRIPPLHLFPDLGIGRVPEAAQVRGHLQRLASRRQQVQQQRDAAVGDARRVGQAEQLLQLHREHRGLAVRVLDAALHAGRHGDAHGRELVDALAQRPVHARLQRVRQVVLAQRLQPCLADERGLQPVVERGHQRVVRQVGQAEIRHPLAQAAHALAPLLQRLGPRQRFQAEIAYGVGQRGGGEGGIDAAGGARVEDDLVETRFALRGQCAACRVPAHRIFGDEAVGEVAAQALLVHRGTALHQRVAVLVAQLADDDPRFADQCAVVEQARAAAVRQQVAARVLRVPETDAVRERVHQHVAEPVRFDRRGRRRGLADASPPLPGGRVDGGQARAVGVDRRTSRTERGQCAPACGQRVAAHAQRIARFDQCGEIAGQCAVFALACRQQHRGQARMRAQCQHALAQCGDGIRRRQRAEATQQIAGRVHRARWRRVDEAQRIAAPGGQFQRQRTEFDQRDLRSPLRIQPLRLRPQAVGPAIGDTAGATGALVGGGLRNRGDFQP